MKISNWIMPPNLAANDSRLDSSIRLVQVNKTIDPVDKLQRSEPNLKKMSRGPARGKIQDFSYHSDTARSVQLAGDFTNWLEQPIDLRKGPNGTWRTALGLERGTHYYHFLVDGQWRDDPKCSSFVPSPFGSQNAVRRVP